MGDFYIQPWDDLEDGTSETLGDQLNGRFDPLLSGVNLSLKPRGAWSSESVVKTNDLYTYAGAEYRALAPSIGITPGTDADKWKVLGGASDGAQSANLVKAGPASGSAAAPTYRALVAADLPAGTTSVQGALRLAGSGSATAGRAVEATDSRLSDARTPTTHSHTASQISDSTTTGRAVLVATDAAAARTALSVPSTSDLSTSAGLMVKRDGSVALTADWDIGGKKLTNAGTPSADGDLVTKAYADALAQGIKFKDAVVVTTTANIGTLSGLLTIDGVALQSGNRVLVKDQTTASQNGIWIADASSWSRAADADMPMELDAGTQTYVQFGTAYGKTAWTLLTPSVTPGTTAQQWTQSASSAQGEANTGNNSGTGTGLIFKAKSGLSLLFRSILAGSSKISVTTGSDEISLDIVEANLTLDNLGGTLSAAKVGASEVASAGAIPKANGGGTLDSSWLGDAYANATQLQGTAISTVAPLAGQVLVYNAGQWEPQTIETTSGGSGSSGTTSLNDVWLYGGF